MIQYVFVRVNDINVKALVIKHVLKTNLVGTF